MRWDTEAQTFLAPSPWPRRGGRGWAREQSSLPRPACPGAHSHAGKDPERAARHLGRPEAPLPRALLYSFWVGVGLILSTAGLPARGHSHVPRPAPRSRSLGIQEGTATVPDAARPEAGKYREPRAICASRRGCPRSYSAPSSPGAPSSPPRLTQASRPFGHSAPRALADPHSPARRGRSAAPSNRPPSSASVTPQFRPAMAPRILGRGGESDCGRWFGAATVGARAWNRLRGAPPRLAHLRAGG